MGIFGGDGQHLHSWGSIFFQDVILPLRKRPLDSRTHIVFLRLSIIGVALFAFIFGALFTQTEYLPMWFNVTTAIFVGGAGAAILGGLYWSRGTTAGAWTGLITGSLLSVGGILLRQPECVALVHAFMQGRGFGASQAATSLLQHIGPDFPLNGTQIGFFASLAALASYILVSFLTCRTPHNMDRLLHRGAYAVEPEAPDKPIAAGPASRRFHLHNIVGIDEHFTRADRWATLGIFFWSLFWSAVFIAGSAAYLIHPWSARTWADYWLVTGIYLPLLISIATSIWFTIGCWRDLVSFFVRLRAQRVDTDDDGTVRH